VKGDPIHPVNHGRTCRKPLELASAVYAADRATMPLMRDRRDVRFREAGWDEAIGSIAGRLAAIVAEHGPDAVGFYISGQLLTEDYYAVNKLAKGFIGTNNVDSNSRLCMSSAVAGYSGAFGYDGPPASYEDIGCSDCLLLLGTNTAACHPIVWSRIRERRAEGACVICVDPRETQTARESTLHLPVRPGTDLALLNAMLNVIEREGMVDEAFLARSTSGWEETLATAREWPARRAAEICGVGAEAIVEAARRFGAGPRSMALWSMGANQSRVGTLKNRALINLCLATGQIGRPGAGPLSLTGQPNAMGGRETGGLAHLLPGYRRVDDAEDRAALEGHWGLTGSGRCISARPGLAALDLFEGLRAGRVKAVWIVATNPAVSLPHSARAREALAAAELVVVQDAHHPTETSTLADAVLPAAAWPEKQGTMTNSERRIGLVRKLVEPPAEALPDWRIFARLAAALGHGEDFAWAGPDEVFAEFAACTAGRPCDMSGVDHERLLIEGSVQWPCPDRHSEGTARLYETGRFPTEDGRARLVPTPQEEPAERPDGRFPLTLSTGRVAEHWHTMSRTGKSARLRRAAPEPLLEVSAADAARFGLRDGAKARIVSRRGESVMRVKIAPGMKEGVVFAPFHWGARYAPAGGGQANNATNPVVDPVSKQPELKAAAVRVEPVAEATAAARAVPGLRVLVIGAGMAAMECVDEVTRRRPPGSVAVTMLGEEPGTPYNRMQLSRLLADEVDAAGLELHPRAWFERHEVELLDGRRAVEVDPERRSVLDEAGRTHEYDALVLATGSRSFVPPLPGADDPAVLGFRTAADVAAIEAAAVGIDGAAVIGGGLLGLEAAAGLRRKGLRVTVLELAPHLMPQQLDPRGGEMLAAALRGLGIESHCGVSARECTSAGVVLADGTTVAADLTVIAAGVRAETSLAAAAGIETGRGILVDDEMRTSAPSVWAIGECAEHRGVVHGLWAPVGAQARAAGAAIAGDVGAFHPEVAATNLTIAGIKLFAGGDPRATGDELIWIDGRRGVYRRLVLDGYRLAAATLLGDVAGARELSALLRSGEPVPEQLLGPPGAAVETPPRSPEELVCSCNAVSVGEIEKAIAAGGARSAAEVGRATRAGTGCGSCLADIEGMLGAHDSSIRNSAEAEAKRASVRIGP
jgi:ferredoxin-nitrate reductase